MYIYSFLLSLFIIFFVFFVGFFAKAETLQFDANSGDGYIKKSNSDWQTARSAISGDYLNYSNNLDRLTETNSGYDIYRGFMSFDVSILPNDAEISSSSLVIYPYQIDDSGTEYSYIQAYNSDFAEINSLELDDYNNYGSTPYTDPIYFNNLSNDEYNNIPLNIDNIDFNSENNLKISIREGHDIDNIANSGTDNIYTYFSEDNNNPPYLEITYSTTTEEDPTTSTPVYSPRIDSVYCQSTTTAEGEVMRCDAPIIIYFVYLITSLIIIYFFYDIFIKQ